MFARRPLLPLALTAAVCLGAVGAPAADRVEAGARETGRKKVADVLIVGDSVGSVLRWAGGAMKPFWDGRYRVFLEVWGCQALMRPGCLDGKPDSALDMIARHDKDGIDVVVVMTGYNDVGHENLRLAMRRITRMASSMGAHVIWLTYRENGNVTIKARSFNKVVRAEDKKLRKLSVLDWEKISRKKRRWFAGDNVHMSSIGGHQLARHIRRALDRHFGLLSTDV